MQCVCTYLLRPRCTQRAYSVACKNRIIHDGSHHGADPSRKRCVMQIERIVRLMIYIKMRNTQTHTRCNIPFTPVQTHTRAPDFSAIFPLVVVVVHLRAPIIFAFTSIRTALRKRVLAASGQRKIKIRR